MVFDGVNMKITDLNIDCLESVFEYLELGDLINVADANKRMNKAANYLFVREQSHKRFYFKQVLISKCQFDGKRLSNTKDWILFRDLKTSLRFIRCFGHLISIVYCEFFRYYDNSKEMIFNYESDHHIMDYVNQYCSESLTQITFKMAMNCWDRLKKPFSKVEHVVFDICQFNCNDLISRLFPKVQKLDVDVFFNNELFFDKPNHFLELTKFSVGLNMCNEDIVPFLHMHPQLEFLSINTINPCQSISSELANAVETLKNLNTLIFFNPDKSPYDDIRSRFGNEWECKTLNNSALMCIKRQLTKKRKRGAMDSPVAKKIKLQ